MGNKNTPDAWDEFFASARGQEQLALETIEDVRNELLDPKQSAERVAELNDELIEAIAQREYNRAVIKIAGDLKAFFLRKREEIENAEEIKRLRGESKMARIPKGNSNPEPQPDARARYLNKYL